MKIGASKERVLCGKHLAKMGTRSGPKGNNTNPARDTLLQTRLHGKGKRAHSGGNDVCTGTDEKLLDCGERKELFPPPNPNKSRSIVRKGEKARQKKFFLGGGKARFRRTRNSAGV